MILLHDIVFRFGEGDFQLQIPQLSIARGAVEAVVGPSGSGKTTLLNLLAGIYRPERGQILVDQLDLASLGDAQRRDFRSSQVGLVFQEFELIDYLNVRENVLLPYLIHHRWKLTDEVRSAAESLLAGLGLAGSLRRPVTRLSHGERQRVAICRALLPRPKLILADEPTGNLDPGTKQQVLQMLLDQARHSGATLLVVTHDQDLLERFDRVHDVRDFQASGDGRSAVRKRAQCTGC